MPVILQAKLGIKINLSSVIEYGFNALETCNLTLFIKRIYNFIWRSSEYLNFPLAVRK